jgi:hypothetical protein
VFAIDELSVGLCCLVQPAAACELVQNTSIQLAATPGHLDVNCYGSGTKQCSRAQIVSIAKPSMIRPYFDGSFLLEGQPSTRDATGKVFAVILWARAARS